VLKRALTVNGSTEREIISGGSFDAEGVYPVTLAARERYQVIVRNDDGDRRVLGSKDVRGDQQIPLKIGEVDVSPPSTQPYAFRIREGETDGGEPRLKIDFADPAQQTRNYRLRVWERHNPENLYLEYEASGPLGNATVYETVPNKSVVVNFTAERGGQRIAAQYPIGGGLGVDIPLDPRWLGTFGLILIAFVSALAAPQWAGQIAVATVSIAGMLMALRVVMIPVQFWFASGLVAVGTYVQHKRRYADA
jgi:hypothetical protein